MSVQMPLWAGVLLLQILAFVLGYACARLTHDIEAYAVRKQRDDLWDRLHDIDPGDKQ